MMIVKTAVMAQLGDNFTGSETAAAMSVVVMEIFSCVYNGCSLWWLCLMCFYQ